MHPLRKAVVIATASLAIVGMTAVVAQAAPATAAPTGQTITVVAGHITTAPAVGPSRAQVAKWSRQMPAAIAAIRRGTPVATALATHGLPPLTPTRTQAATPAAHNKMRPMNFSCQRWTCGFQFNPTQTWELEWLVWAGSIAGPGAICFVLGPPTLGYACGVADALWSLVASYKDTPPNYVPYICIYIGTGWGNVAIWEFC